MERIREKWDSWVEWSSRSAQNLTISLAMCLLASFLSLFLSVWLPAHFTANALEGAEQAIANAEAQQEIATTRYQAEAPWYTSIYTKDEPGKLTWAQKWLSDDEWQMDDGSMRYGVEKALSKAKSWNPDATLKWAKIAQESAQEAQGLAESVIAMLDANKKEREATRTRLAAVTDEWSKGQEQRGLIVGRFNQEADQWLSKYTIPMNESLKSAEQSGETARDHLVQALTYLPQDEDKTGKGDPRAAQVQMGEAKMAIDEMNTLVEEVTAGLDYQLEARNNAASTTQKAETDVSGAWNHVEQIREARQWSYDKALQKTKSLYDQGHSSWQHAVQVLTSPIEEAGKIDWPDAYESSRSAINLAAQAIAEADRMVEVADYIAANIPVAESQIATANTKIVDAERALDGLRQDHYAANWSGQDQNLAQAESQRDSATNLLATTRSQASLEQQMFDAAKAALDQAISAARSAQGLADTVTARYNELEQYRAQTPGAIASAESAISAASGTVSSLRGYSSRGSSEFSQAESELQAVYAARGRQDWPAAVQHADNAANMAANAASYCRADATATEERHIEETRQAHAEETRVAAAATRRAEEAEEAAEAARRAAEEAARQSSTSSSSSSSWDSSSSSSWSSSDTGSSSNSWSSSGTSNNNSW